MRGMSADMIYLRECTHQFPVMALKASLICRLTLRTMPRSVYGVDKTGNHSANATRVANNTGGVISRPIFMYCPQLIL